jgi:hypothetical protein
MQFRSAGHLKQLAAAAIMAGLLPACAGSPFRPEVPGVFYKAAFEFVSNDICEDLADYLHAQEGLTEPGANAVSISGIRCHTTLQGVDGNEVSLQLTSDTLWIGVRRYHRPWGIMAPTTATRDLASNVIGVVKKRYPAAAVEQTKVYENLPW